MPARRIVTGPGPAPDAVRGTVAAVPVPVAPVAAVALYDVDPDGCAARVLACPAVAGLSGGPFGAAATYLPGRTVPGVRISADTVEVHVVLRYGATVGELARQVRAALAGIVLGRSVDIVVEDVDDSPGTPAGAPATTAGARPVDAAAPVARAGAPAAPEATTASGSSSVGPPATPAGPPGRWTRPGRPG